MTKGPVPSNFKDHAEIVQSMEKIASGVGSPASILQHAMMAAMSKNASQKAKETYEALRDRFRSKPVRGPEGALYKLSSLQREYVRYVLVERYRAAGHKGHSAYCMASDYLTGDNHVAWDTVRDTHNKIKKLLAVPGMVIFCQGLEYEFQIALYGDETPPAGSLIEPDFMQE